MFDHQDLPEFSWSHMEQLYRQSQAQWQQTKRSLLQQVHGSQTFRSAWQVLAEWLMADKYLRVVVGMPADCN
jgi:hypothetical protein